MSRESLGLRKVIVLAVALPFLLYLSQNMGRVIHRKEIQKLNGMTSQDVREYIQTRKQWQFYNRYCLDDRLSPNEIKSPERTHIDRGGDCGDKSLRAFYDLEDDGFHNTFIDIYKKRVIHRLFLVEDEHQGHKGIGRTYWVLGDGDRGQYPSLEAIARAKGGHAYRLLRFNPQPGYATTRDNLNVNEAWTHTSELISLR